MALPRWPFAGDLAYRRSVRAYIAGAAATGGRGATGEQSIARFDGGGFWVAEEICSLRSDAAVRLWSSWAARLDGGASPVIVPLKHRVSAVPGIDSAVLASAAALRATLLSVQITGSGAPFAGGRFTINHAAWGPRLYEIIEAADEGSGLWTLTTRTPLRQAHALSAALDFNDPRFVARLTNPAEFPISEDGAVANPTGRATWAEWGEAVA